MILKAAGEESGDSQSRKYRDNEVSLNSSGHQIKQMNVYRVLMEQDEKGIAIAEVRNEANLFSTRPLSAFNSRRTSSSAGPSVFALLVVLPPMPSRNDEAAGIRYVCDDIYAIRSVTESSVRERDVERDITAVELELCLATSASRPRDSASLWG